MSNLTGRNIKDSYQELVTLSGSLLTDGTGSVISSFSVTASNATSASVANYADQAGIATFAGSATLATSASVATSASQAANASTAVTASFALGNFYAVNWNNSIDTLTFTKGDGTTQAVVIDVTGSVQNAATASYILGSGVDGAVALATNATNATSASYANNAGASATAVSASYANNAGASATAVSSSYATNAGNATSSSFATSASFANNAGNAATANIAGTAANADLLDNLNSTAFAILANNNVFGGATQTFTNIAVNGTASIGYLESVTGSVKIIGDAFIILNNDTPTERYAGVKVIDSGSVNTTASFQFDGLTNDWFYEYTGSDPTNYGVAMFGPEYATKGSPTYLTANKLAKGDGGHHLNDSTITDTGALVSIGVGVNVTGSVTATSFIGNLTGNADTATNATSASYAAVATSASVANSATFADTAGFATNATSASYANNAGAASTATSASYALNAGSAFSATSASYADNAGNAFTATSASVAVTSSYAHSANFALTATSSSWADNAGNSATADLATTASYATVAASLLGGVGQFATTGSNTFIGGQTFSGSVTGEVKDITVASSTASIDCSAANFFTLAIPTAATTHLTATNIAPGKTINLRLTQPATTGSITYGGMFAFVSESFYTASAASNAVDILTFITFDSSKLYTVDVKNFV